MASNEQKARECEVEWDGKHIYSYCAKCFRREYAQCCRLVSYTDGDGKQRGRHLCPPCRGVKDANALNQTPAE